MRPGRLYRRTGMGLASPVATMWRLWDARERYPARLPRVRVWVEDTTPGNQMRARIRKNRSCFSTGARRFAGWVSQRSIVGQVIQGERVERTDWSGIERRFFDEVRKRFRSDRRLIGPTRTTRPPGTRSRATRPRPKESPSHRTPRTSRRAGGRARCVSRD